jgi:hypothetical protein
MFNLLVAGQSEMWETPPYSFPIVRFKEYSGDEAANVDLARPETIRALEGVPMLLMYEVGAGGAHDRVVRHGRARNISRRGTELTFDFELHEQHAFLERSSVLAIAEQLDIRQFERHRTHWAIKDGNLPEELIATGTAERAERPVAIVAAEFTEAKRDRRRGEAAALLDELAAYPPSFEKAMALLPAQILAFPTPELFPLVGIEPRTPEGRNALLKVIQTNDENDDLPSTWNISYTWFLSLYGTATEKNRLDVAIDQSAQEMMELGREEQAQEDLIEKIGFVLWRVSRSRALVGRLQKQISVLTGLLIKRQSQGRGWTAGNEIAQPQSIRATALAVVALQRLGDDRYHIALDQAVTWLLSKAFPIGAFPRDEDSNEPDLVSTVLVLEAIRRSSFIADVPHLLESGDTWLMSQQGDGGIWAADPWSESFTAGVVLDYLANRNQMLAQVDGFLLMARDFFRKAEELQHEGGSNNRRLAAIATVHAVEMFLYGLFERREDLALSPFKENGTETLGPREALRAFQEALQRIGVLTPPQRLPHRDRISALIGRRDGIIHRAHEVSENELSEGLREAKKFLDRFAKDLLNIDLLQ